MACPLVTTGNQFLVSTLSHLDCQAQTLGSFGFQALASPNSPAALALTTLLTLFIAIYGLRLLFSPAEEPRNLVNAVLKVAIVFTLALSWPAWRIAAYDTVLHGPAEVAATIMPTTLSDPRQSFPQRLQAVDTAIAAFTAFGTGRQTGRLIDERATGSFRAIALEDEAGLGWSRPIFLASTIGSLAALRVAGGLLLALAPLLAGLLLFDLTRGLFMGWLRGLALVALGSLALTVLFSVQVAIMEPWLASVLNRRSLGYATPAAPTELLALVVAFGIATAILMAILAKVAFQSAWTVGRSTLSQHAASMARLPIARPVAMRSEPATISRAAAISESVANTVRREETSVEGRDWARSIRPERPNFAQSAPGGSFSAPMTPLGSGYRRTGARATGSHQKRDARQ